MKLIVGLGNPGEKYKNNRHNVGFQFLDYLIENLQFSISNNQFPNNIQKPSFKFQKHLSSNIYHLSSNVLLAKPQTFMNLSGFAVKKILTNHQPLTTNHLIIIHDDLDIPLGMFKIQKGTGPLLHNGVESVENALGTKDFWRVRIGVDNRLLTGYVDGEVYVLNNFMPKEKKLLFESVFPKILARLKTDFSL